MSGTDKKIGVKTVMVSLGDPRILRPAKGRGVYIIREGLSLRNYTTREKDFLQQVVC